MVEAMICNRFAIYLHMESYTELSSTLHAQYTVLCNTGLDLNCFFKVKGKCFILSTFWNTTNHNSKLIFFYSRNVLLHSIQRLDRTRTLLRLLVFQLCSKL